MSDTVMAKLRSIIVGIETAAHCAGFDEGRAAERARVVALIDQQRQKLVRDITDIYSKDMSDDSRRTMGEWVRCESLLTRLRNAINELDTTAAEGGSTHGADHE